MKKNVFSVLCVAFLCCTAVNAAYMDFVTVGDIGNTADTRLVRGAYTFGAVNYEYQLGKYETSNSQYAAFLNAVAANDTHGVVSQSRL